jgi:hypothetical protein
MANRRRAVVRGLFLVRPQEGYGYTEDGQFGQVYNYSFRSSEIRDPLHDAVNEHGWGSKAVSFRL